MSTFLVVLLNVTVHVVPSCTAVITEWTRKWLFSRVHADMHVKLLFGEKLFVTVSAGVVISALVFFLTETQLLLVFEFSTTGLTTEICFSCVCWHMVPGKYGFNAKERKNNGKTDLQNMGKRDTSIQSHFGQQNHSQGEGKDE